MRTLIPPGLLLAMTASAAIAQDVPPMQTSTITPAPRASVTTLAEMVENDFFDPVAGARYAAILRARAASGAYDRVRDRAALATRLTDELQAVAADGHLRVMLPPPPPVAGDPPNAVPGAREAAIESARWLAPGIAYIRFNAFPGDPETIAATRAFMVSHADARTLIVDIRTHRGGGLAEMDQILPWLYARPTSLVMMDTRAAVEQRHGAFLPEGPTLRRVASPAEVVRREHHVVPGADASLRDAQVYLLTSSVTGSAAEHLALALKRTRRATLIGEATAGANHFGGIAPVDETLAVFMPVGRTFDPDTGRDWEGVGVTPDVEVAAENALIETLTRAGIEAGDATRLSAGVAPTAPMRRDRGRPRPQTAAD